jgi:hypothetical protein
LGELSILQLFDHLVPSATWHQDKRALVFHVVRGHRHAKQIEHASQRQMQNIHLGEDRSNGQRRIRDTDARPIRTTHLSDNISKRNPIEDQGPSNPSGQFSSCDARCQCNAGIRDQRQHARGRHSVTAARCSTECIAIYIAIYIVRCIVTTRPHGNAPIFDHHTTHRLVGKLPNLEARA